MYYTQCKRDNTIHANVYENNVYYTVLHCIIIIHRNAIAGHYSYTVMLLMYIHVAKCSQFVLRRVRMFKELQIGHFLSTSESCAFPSSSLMYSNVSVVAEVVIRENPQCW